jgi:hypothetical protein
VACAKTRLSVPGSARSSFHAGMTTEINRGHQRRVRCGSATEAVQL